MVEKLKQLQELVEHFKYNLSEYKSSAYDEANTRVDFIDKLFEILDWDVSNKQQFSEEWREVVREDKVIIQGKPKAPDYSFRIGGKRMFFVEAKKPSIDIKHDIGPAYQVRRYGYTAKVPLSILTDFEEFAVYDTRIKPNKNDKASVARIFYCTFEEYENHLEFLANTFSKNAILKGSFKKYITDNKAKKGTSEVDTEFLKLIEQWRNDIARNLALRNKDLNVRELNYAVQKIIDRILFLRIAEDRQTEEYGALLKLTGKPEVYPSLTSVFKKADEKYNSGLFHSETFLSDLIIDDKILSSIIKGLYYPDSPYEFSVLEVEILGNIYEQFLGKTIRLTPSHQAKVEEKPEVRKAGGVYYTPQFVVDYIVSKTVGVKIENKTPVQISKIKILDPACGSGSFLLGAYSYLLKYHLDFYSSTQKLKSSLKDGKIFQTGENTFYLTIKEKQNILLNNIHGVDIDAQAVEVTKLSLLLKLMEGENQESVGSLFKFSDFVLLPDLSQNIKCGNSLIETNFYAQQQLNLFDDEQIRKINAFDWKTEFASIFANGGFDVLIGNPPYVRIQTMKEWAPDEISFFRNNYISAHSGNYDIYVIFIEKGFSLLNTDGLLGYILPNKFLSTDYGVNTRKLISSKRALIKLIDFGHSQVFKQATTYTCLLFLSSKSVDTFSYKSVDEPTDIGEKDLEFTFIDSKELSSAPWSIFSKDEKDIKNKLFLNSKNLVELASNISRGSSSGNDKIFLLTKSNLNKEFISFNKTKIVLEEGILRKPIFATDFQRFNFNPKNDKYIIFPYQRIDNKFELITEQILKEEYPLAYNYLSSNKKELLLRKQFKSWYSFSAPRNLIVHDGAHFIVPLLANKGSISVLPSNNSAYCIMASAGFSIQIKPDLEISKKYILGLLNSSLLFWYLRLISNKFRGGWITCTKQYMNRLPIQNIDFSVEKYKTLHDDIDSLVTENLRTHNILQQIKIESDKKIFRNKLKLIENQINHLVYNLYDLTEKEIEIIEQN